MWRHNTPAASEFSDHSSDARNTVEMAVEAEDVLYAVLSHDSYVDGISRRQIGVADDDIPSTFDNFEVHRQHLVDDLEQYLEARLDGIAAIDRHVTVKDLLQDPGIGNESALLGNGTFEQTASVDLVRMLRAHQVHRDIRVDQDHSPTSP